MGDDLRENIGIPDNEMLLIDFETATDITIESLSQSNVTSPVWKDFGIIKKSGRLLTSLQRKIFCKLCFVNKQLKRYANE